jgi:hypothetical protein
MIDVCHSTGWDMFTLVACATSCVPNGSHMLHNAALQLSSACLLAPLSLLVLAAHIMHYAMQACYVWSEPHQVLAAGPLQQQ